MCDTDDMTIEVQKEMCQFCPFRFKGKWWVVNAIIKKLNYWRCHVSKTQVCFGHYHANRKAYAGYSPLFIDDGATHREKIKGDMALLTFKHGNSIHRFNATEEEIT